MSKDRKLRARRLLKGLLRIWFYGTCGLTGLWAMNIVSGEMEMCVLGAPVLFLVLCGIVPPGTRQGHGRCEWDEEHRDSFSRWDRWNGALSYSLMNNSRSDEDAWRSSDDYGFSDSKSHTVMDLNSDGSFNAMGTGTMSSGTQDW
ncbi:MAG: hypothetical protein ACLQO1_07715 [Steroidobacteraceae bacterium]